MILVIGLPLWSAILLASILSYVFTGIMEVIKGFKQEIISRPMYTYNPTPSVIIGAVLTWPLGIKEKDQGFFAFISGIITNTFGTLFNAFMWALIVGYYLNFRSLN